MDCLQNSSSFLIFSNNLHNSDLRDSHEYIQKQVGGELIRTRHSGRMFELIAIRLTDTSGIVCLLWFFSPHILRNQLLCTKGCLSNLSCTLHAARSWCFWISDVNTLWQPSWIAWYLIFVVFVFFHVYVTVSITDIKYPELIELSHCSCCYETEYFEEQTDSWHLIRERLRDSAVKTRLENIETAQDLKHTKRLLNTICCWHF